MGATVHFAAGLHPVANHLATAVGALRCERMNGTFKAVIMVDLPLRDNFDGFIVIVPANFAFHTHTSARRAKAGAPSPSWVFPGES